MRWLEAIFTMFIGRILHKFCLLTFDENIDNTQKTNNPLIESTLFPPFLDLTIMTMFSMFYNYFDF